MEEYTKRIKPARSDLEEKHDPTKLIKMYYDGLITASEALGEVWKVSWSNESIGKEIISKVTEQENKDLIGLKESILELYKKLKKTVEPANGPD